MRTNDGDRRPRLWLIVGRDEEGGEPGPLAVDVRGEGRALAVFSFEEEAQMYLLLLRAPIGRWHVEETWPEELASLLLSETCSGAQLVVLDPMGEILAHNVNCLLSTSRESFLGHLLALEPEVAVGSTRNG